MFFLGFLYTHKDKSKAKSQYRRPCLIQNVFPKHSNIQQNNFEYLELVDNTNQKILNHRSNPPIKTFSTLLNSSTLWIQELQFSLLKSTIVICITTDEYQFSQTAANLSRIRCLHQFLGYIQHWLPLVTALVANIVWLWKVEKWQFDKKIIYSNVIR